MDNLRAEYGGWTHQDRNGIHIKPCHGWVHTEADNYERGDFVVGERRLLPVRDWAVWQRDEEEPTARRFPTSAAARQWVESPRDLIAVGSSRCGDPHPDWTRRTPDHGDHV